MSDKHNPSNLFLSQHQSKGRLRFHDTNTHRKYKPFKRYKPFEKASVGTAKTKKKPKH